jgi:glycosyltransferase involved in cell wall biosynthesis
VVVTGTTGIPGGISTLNMNILREVQEIAREREIELEVLSYLDDNEDRPDFLGDQVTFRSFSGSKIRFSVVLAQKPVEADLLIFDHVHMVPPILPLLHSVGRARVVIFAHGSEAWRHVRRTSKWVFKQADLCIANSSFTLRKMEEALGEFNGEPCLLGLSPEFDLNSEIDYETEEDIYLTAVDGSEHRLKDRVLLLVGRMMRDEPGKGRWPLLQIFPDILRQYPEAQLVFPGPGDEREDLAEYSERLGVGESVFLPGFVSDEVLDQLYRKCFAYVMPSTQEGFGLVYLEAMNYGKPCVGCWDDGAQDVIVNNETGYLIDKASHKELFDVVTRLLDDPEEAERLGENGFRRLHNNFTAVRFRDRLKNRIEGLLQ